MHKSLLAFILLFTFFLSISAQNVSVKNRLEQEYDLVSNDLFGSGYYVRLSEKEGYCGADGKEIIRPQSYTSVHTDRDSKVLLGFYVKNGEKEGYCNADGKEIIRPQSYTSVYTDRDGKVLLGFRVKNGEKAGYCDADGKEIIRPQSYTSVYTDRDGKVLLGFRVYNGGKEGYCDVDGKEIIRPQYSSVYVDRDYNTKVLLGFSVKNGEKKGYCDADGKELIQPKSYTSVEADRDYYTKALLGFKVRNGEKAGYCDLDVQELIQPKNYTSVKADRDNENNILLGFEVWNGEKAGYCDAAGNELLQPQEFTLVKADRDSENNILLGFKVWNGEKAGYCDADGQEIISPQRYGLVFPDWDYKTKVLLGFKVSIREKGEIKEGYCDAEGKEIIQPQSYSSVYADRDYDTKTLLGFKVSKGEDDEIEWGYCDADGKEIIRPRYAYITADRDDDTNILLGFEVWNGREDEFKEGYCNTDGKEIIRPSYTYITVNRDDDTKILLGFKVWNGRKVGYMDAQGRELIPLQYSDIIYHNNGFIVKYEDKEGLYNKEGELLMPPTKYTYIRYDAGADMYQVKKGDEVGYCSRNWNEVIPTEYSVIVHRKDEDIAYFIVEKNGKIGLMDSLGKAMVEPIFDSLFTSTEGLCRVKRENWGYISIKDGTLMVPLVYDKVSPFKDGVARVTKNGKTMLLSNPLKAVAQTNNQPKVKGKAVSTYPAPDSDIDKDIPMGKKADDNTYAFIIANENYLVAKVPYALNDGWLFEQYCKKTLGIKEENVYLYEDATGGNIMACVEQLKQVAKTTNGQATIIFYYTGHGFPDEEKKTAYLLPVDGDSKNPSTGYSLEKLYQEMSSVQVKQMVCFLDACFSGATRDDQMLITGRGVVLKVRDEIPQGNMVVMTSATGAETAHSFEEMHHGLFTYYLLQKLQETKGDVTLGDLSEYVIKMVKRKSVLINQKKQTPTVIPSPKLQASWREMKL